MSTSTTDTPLFLLSLRNFQSTEVAKLQDALTKKDKRAIIVAVLNILYFYKSVATRLDHLNMPCEHPGSDFEIINSLIQHMGLMAKMAGKCAISGAELAIHINRAWIKSREIETRFIADLIIKAEPIEMILHRTSFMKYEKKQRQRYVDPAPTAS